MLTLVSGTEFLTLEKDDARELELKLNVSYYGHDWISIGDALFEFHSSGSSSSSQLEVTTEQLAFLKKLNEQRGWESCKNYGAPKK